MTFSLLPEWHPQDAVMLTWPHQDTDWAANLSAVEQVYLELSKHISERQRLLIVADNAELKAHIHSALSEQGVDLTQVNFVDAPCNDTWARDHGPLTLSDGQQLKAIDCQFTAWGGKYEADKDNAINGQLFAQALNQNVRTEQSDFILEGGAIEINEQGVLLSTRACVHNKNRNASMSAEQIDAALSELLGAKKILWLDHGYLAGDDTDSHIDTLVRFAPNNTLVYVRCDDPQDEHYDELGKMAEELVALRGLNDDAYELIALPWPKAVYNSEGERLPATYANYLIINDAVLVPTYNDSHDQVALAQIAKAYPGREVIGVDCCALIEQFGSLHCITMQLPHGFLENK
ncbi:agmatine deiminase family protein [Pseudoalteromonas sp. T1lg48]|uniref:agmatine deiminase family protein n=1 Tax=Pseudoalteromonas sp. T1lg48 TaxID=2077100 RepID=UPI000CF5EC91|nr:agmatine deiminase family protein [Pseudoalteromonas sp. T1lg48]